MLSFTHHMWQDHVCQNRMWQHHMCIHIRSRKPVQLCKTVTNSVVATASMKHSSARPLAGVAASALVTRRAERAGPTNNSGTPRKRDTPSCTSNAHTNAVALMRIYARCCDQIRAREPNPITRQERRGPRCCLFTPPVEQSALLKPRNHVELHREPRRFLGIKH